MANCCVWDVTVAGEDHKELITLFKKHCKKWCFQLEEGKSGYQHLQDRVSFKKKLRLTGCKKVHDKAHWSPTSAENRDNCFYVTKEETRKGGPWMDQEQQDEDYVPRQVREMTKLRPWQDNILSQCDVWDTRTINVVIDKKGGIGKTCLMTYARAHGIAKKVPFCNSHKDVMRMVYAIGVSRCYMFDMPRAINKDQLSGFYAAIEEIKSGYCYDDRYHFRDRVMDCPNIWVFTNKDPDLQLLSKDRWRLWKVVEGRLERYDILEEVQWPQQ